MTRMNPDEFAALLEAKVKEVDEYTSKAIVKLNDELIVKISEFHEQVHGSHSEEKLSDEEFKKCEDEFIQAFFMLLQTKDLENTIAAFKIVVDISENEHVHEPPKKDKTDDSPGLYM